MVHGTQKPVLVSQKVFSVPEKLTVQSAFVTQTAMHTPAILGGSVLVSKTL
jgi:hypothetical protein